MSHQIDDLQLVLCRGANGNRIKVSIESYLLFNSEIDYALEGLVDRWSDFITAHSEVISHRS